MIRPTQRPLAITISERPRPTRLVSPFPMLTNRGGPSRPQLRKARPTVATRRSSLVVPCIAWFAAPRSRRCAGFCVWSRAKGCRTTPRRAHAAAAFAKPDIHEFPEAAGYGCAIGLPAKQVLRSGIAHLLGRLAGRPPSRVRVYHADIGHQAAKWSGRAARWPRPSGIPAKAARGSLFARPACLVRRSR